MQDIAAASTDGAGEVLVGTFGEVGAVWSEVAVDEFCGEAAEARLADIAWLAPRAVRHEKVIEAWMLQSPVLPAGFATLFSSLESLEGLISEQKEAIAGFFETLGEAREWSVKGRLDRARAVDGFAAERMSARAGVSPGAQYLEERRIRGEADRTIGPWVEALCRDALPELQAEARAFRERPARSGPAAAGNEVIFNWAFLLAPEREAEFARAVARLQAKGSSRGFDYSLTGPWPAYSFAPALTRNVP